MGTGLLRKLLSFFLIVVCILLVAVAAVMTDYHYLWPWK